MVTTATSGPDLETITYYAWSVDPGVVNSVHQVGFTGPPTPDESRRGSGLRLDLGQVLTNLASGSQTM